MSGRRGSNPRPSAWKADALSLSYFRIARFHGEPVTVSVGRGRYRHMPIALLLSLYTPTGGYLACISPRSPHTGLSCASRLAGFWTDPASDRQIEPYWWRAIVSGINTGAMVIPARALRTYSSRPFRAFGRTWISGVSPYRGTDGTRTRDFHRDRVALYQLNYCSSCRTIYGTEARLPSWVGCALYPASCTRALLLSAEPTACGYYSMLSPLRPGPETLQEHPIWGSGSAQGLPPSLPPRSQHTGKQSLNFRWFVPRTDAQGYRG